MFADHTIIPMVKLANELGYPLVVDDFTRSTLQPMSNLLSLIDADFVAEALLQSP